MKTLFIMLLVPVFITGCNVKNNQSETSETNAEASPENPKENMQQKAETQTLYYDFEETPTGQFPAGWTAYLTGQGEMPVWKVMEEEGNKVLAQLSEDNPSNHFNVIVYDNWQVRDVTLTVRFKGIKGKIDQGGGFVWRFADANNYYIVRANPLEDNVVLYKVEDGKRTDLPLVGKGRTYGMDVEVPANQWHDLKLVAKGNRFTIFINGKELFQVEDDTFTQAGKVGFWTKADAVTYFDDFKVTNDQ